MRIIQISPGAGASYQCDNCLRDNALALELRRRGHDLLMVPLYLPMPEGLPDAAGATPIFFGGINVYLQQKSALFRRTPRWLDRPLDSPRLLRWAGRLAAMTKAEDLGEPMISMLRGEEGRQAKELDRLIEWLSGQDRPDVIVLSNALLVGLVRRLKAALGVPVVCMLQDEDGFLDALSEPYRGEAWRTLADRAADVDTFIAVSKYYAGVMRSRLGAPEERVRTVLIGIDPAGYAPAAASPQPPCVGFLAPLCPEKGLDLLAEAYLDLRAGGPAPGLRLRVAGDEVRAARDFAAGVFRRLREAGAADVELVASPDRAARQEFLRSVTVLAVPARQAEAFGVFILESLASGVPLVLPRLGAYPELLEATGGGVLVEPDDPRGLAAAIGDLLAHPEEARAIGRRGREAVLARFTVGRMAADLLEVLEQVSGKAHI
jgi:glycosyltransferase involved in cell wall biosynthesis